MKNSASIDWSGRDEQLKKLVADGQSASKIAKVFGDCSRSSVIGRVYRLGLKFKGNKSGPQPGTKRRTAEQAAPKARKPRKKMVKLVAGVPQRTIGKGPKAASQYDIKGRAEQRAASAGLEPHLVAGDAKRPVYEFAQPVSRRLALMQLTERTCRWPHGDPRADDFHFCGNDTGFKGAYCPYHARIAFTPLTQRQLANLKSAERTR